MVKSRAIWVVSVLVALAGVAPAAAADPGTVNIVSSSHQDTAWMDTPAFCRNYRIEKNILPALDLMARDPDYTFTMECMLHLMEFLETHPERAAEIIELTRAGRFEWGATYNQPYEAWLSGEELVRELYYGRRWLKKNFPGCDARVAFNPDVPARSIQMQQVLAKAGVPYLLGSRYTKGLYDWESPDGSGVIFYSMGHYTNPSRKLKQPAPLAAWAVGRELDRLAPYYRARDIAPAFCMLNSVDFSVPRDFSPLLNGWNQGWGRLATRAPEFDSPPRMRYATAAQFFDAVSAGNPRFDRLMGERPDVWLYIHGPTHHLTSSIRRSAARELTTAETLTVIARLLAGSSAPPPENFDRAWMDLLYIDHGIGGKNGHITDVVFQRTTARALSASRSGDEALNRISDRVKIDLPPGSRKLIVFNPFPFPLTTSLDVPLPEPWKSARVFDPDGSELPAQPVRSASPAEINVALSTGPAPDAAASSVSGPDDTPDKAIDGQWDVAETHPELGPSQAWHSRPGPGPHWLTVDFGQPRSIHRVVIRHYGCIGQFHAETRLTTADFRLQGADSSAGPWSDLVPPVINNTLPLTSHHFRPRSVRCLRLYITRGTQAGGDGAARILEMEAFAADPAPPGSQRIVMTAEKIPPLGYRTYVVTPIEAAPASPADGSSTENQFYRISLAPGGVKSIYDKQQDRELLQPGKFLGGEVFTLLSPAPADRPLGTDAGEFGRLPHAVMDASFDQVSRHTPAWALVENGPARTVYELTQPLADVTVRQRVILWRWIKRIDFEADLIEFNGRPWREFRLALPLALENPEIAYEAPMGVVRVGRDEIPGIGGQAHVALTYSEEIKSIHPREVLNFIDASDARGGITLSSSVSVFDWIDPAGHSASYPILQPVLLASRKSCNVQGNWYPQAGTHHYRFSLTSHEGDWRNGWREGVAANSGVKALLPSIQTGAPAADLPPSMSFFSLSADNVMITAVKQAEDDGDVVVRLVEMEGRDTEVTLRTHGRIVSAARTDIIEENPRPVPAGEHEITLTIGHNAIETIKLRMQE
jgi:hypothetical protein